MLKNKLKNKKIILASQSPRRKELMKGLDIDFEVKTKSGIDETVPENIDIKDAALYVAKQKAKAFENEISKDVILITSDTIVCLENEILVKPENFKDAFQILQKLSGKKHQVITGVCIWASDKKVEFSDTTNVYFKELTDDEIKYYIENYEPYDKAGAYGIQEWIGYTAVEKIEGSYFNVVGFPIQKVYKKLLDFLQL